LEWLTICAIETIENYKKAAHSNREIISILLVFFHTKSKTLRSFNLD
jgi:hypothetical protein